MSLFGNNNNNAFGARPAFGAAQPAAAASNPFGTAGAANTSANTTVGAQQGAPIANPDIELSQPPPDSISSMAFSSAAEFLAVASWDNSVRIYGIEANGTSAGKASYNHEAPVLDVIWSPDGSKVLSAGADKAARLFDLSTGQATQVAAHDQSIKCLRWIDLNGGILATGSWDKTVKYWDLRSPNPIATAPLAERCYAMDVCQNYLVVGTAERKVQVFDLAANPASPLLTMESPLKWQTRSLSCFKGGAVPGFGIGSIEGRVAIQHIREENKGSNFSFKCHRKEPPPANRSIPSQLFSVNALAFHPTEGTFVSAGSDGTMSSWDKDNKVRLRAFDNKGGPVTAATFNRTGNILAYAVSYDWSQGWQGAGKGPNTVYLHACKDEEIRKRIKK